MSDQDQNPALAEEVVQEEVSHAEQTFDGHFARLRASISDAFTYALTAGETLYRSNAPTPLAFGTFYNTVPEEHKAHYNCNCCRGFMNRFSGLLLSDKAGGYYSPVAKILEEDSFFGAVLKEQGINLSMKAALRSAKPVAFLPAAFSRATSANKKGEGVWTHLFGADIELVEKYNSQHGHASETISRATVIWENMRGLGLNNHAFLLKLHDNIAAGLTKPSSIGLVKPYAALMSKLVEFKHGQVSYISSLLMQEEYTWLNQINGSSGGHVLKAALEVLENPSSVGDVVKRVTAFVNKITRDAVYKTRMAEASAGLVDGTVLTLKEDGLENALVRTPVLYSDLPWSWKSKKPMRHEEGATQAEEVPAEEVNLPEVEENVASALDIAAKALKGKDDQSAEDAAAALAAFESTNLIPKDISLAGFLEVLKEDDVESVELSMRGVRQDPICWTKSKDGRTYSELFKFSPSFEELGWLGIGIPQGLAPVEAMYFATAPGEEGGDAFDYLDIAGTVTMNNEDGSLRTVVVVAENIGYKLFTNHPVAGTFVFGPHIKQKYYGYSRALTQLSSKIPMNIPTQTAGGFQLGIGHTLKVKRSSGLMTRYTIRSVE